MSEILTKGHIFIEYNVKIINGLFILIIKLYIRFSARDMFLTFFVTRLFLGRVTLDNVIKRSSVIIHGFTSIIYYYVSRKKALKDLINIDKLFVGEKRLRLSVITTIKRFFSRFNEEHLAR
jgi:hypothetical protein